MKILLIGNYFADGQQSMLGFSSSLSSELRKAGQEVRVIHPEARLGRSNAKRGALTKWLAYIDKFVLFLPQLRAAAKSTDVVHICDHAYALYTRSLSRIPTVVTCHDLLAVRCALGEFPGQNLGWTGKKYQQMILRGLNRASLVGCDSVATRSDVLRLSQLPLSQTTVVHVGFNYPYRPTSTEEKSERFRRLGIGVRDRYMIHVGADVWYKNLPGVIRIFSRLANFPETRDLRLVMVGNGQRRHLNALLEGCGLDGRVLMLSCVSSEDLRALYSGACGLLFPSICEGFGWPIIEAQACECPVFASNRPPMIEIGGEGAVYFNPEAYDEAADAVRHNFSHASEMRAAGLHNASRFSAPRMAADYLQLYARAIALEPGSHRRTPQCVPE
jgi:glycosyltransferase involved in cell wall biosynthesis